MVNTFELHVAYCWLQHLCLVSNDRFTHYKLQLTDSYYRLHLLLLIQIRSVEWMNKSSPLFSFLPSILISETSYHHVRSRPYPSLRSVQHRWIFVWNIPVPWWHTSNAHNVRRPVAEKNLSVHLFFHGFTQSTKPVQTKVTHSHCLPQSTHSRGVYHTTQGDCNMSPVDSPFIRCKMNDFYKMLLSYPYSRYAFLDTELGFFMILSKSWILL